MATNLALDDNLLQQAVAIGGLKTKKDTVTLALKEFIQRREAEKLIAAFGTVDFDEDYDYKAERMRHAKVSG
ncbi:type II toxin-antitoxin system VapB family antitoxin [uncultured Selenomonas sp.]|uniref:type II toxin-antitoxin system VapB family antitoxin n=1 Tax=uncultured Selenomonas sp. TaxID=159275 RepID=UPI0025D62FC8|nr:type II toxin-antitoxin system VapB family antitoxin [uncultured Selenomonas sp.]